MDLSDDDLYLLLRALDEKIYQLSTRPNAASVSWQFVALEQKIEAERQRRTAPRTKASRSRKRV